MNWISNVDTCIDEADALSKLEKQINNVLFPKSIEIHLDKNNMKYCEYAQVYYVDIVLSHNNTGDIISNISSPDDFNNYMRILIDDTMVTNIDYVFMIACPLSEIKFRFFLNHAEISCEFDKIVTMDCIILTTENKAKLNLGAFETPYFYYKDGKCFPRNINIMYVNNII